ncbi:MAG: hypothetical protein LWX56_10475 [Ignavibacteria bacterium]|nr:hypothetical protein [Ignavibacteria bacterium]
MSTILDNSNYLKGLLILARQDKKLASQEKDFIRGIAQRFGFSKDFYEDTLKYLMSNKYIVDEPIHFSEKSIAESFLNDGLELAMSDDDLDTKELAWLKKTAEANQINSEAFENIVATHRQQKTAPKVEM